jgi:hypothetical protein
MLDIAPLQPARKPEGVAAGLIGGDNALNVIRKPRWRAADCARVLEQTPRPNCFAHAISVPQRAIPRCSTSILQAIERPASATAN